MRRLTRRVLRTFPLLLCFLFLGLSSASAEKPKVAVLPFQLSGKTNANNIPVLVLPVLLQEYLSHVKGFSFVLKNSPGPQDRYWISGILAKNEDGYLVKTTLYKTGGDAATNPSFEGTFLFPFTLNSFLPVLAEEIAKALGKKLEEKKILPYLNRTVSTDAYLLYAKAVFLMNVNHDPQQASVLFEQAIQNDYNYVPAYARLSQSLKATAAMIQSTNPQQAAVLQTKAKTAFEKAKLLNPVVTKGLEQK
jgi:hypothetical protein